MRKGVKKKYFIDTKSNESHKSSKEKTTSDRTVYIVNAALLVYLSVFSKLGR